MLFYPNREEHHEGFVNDKEYFKYMHIFLTAVKQVPVFYSHFRLSINIPNALVYHVYIYASL